jgi:hypothetical protein
MVLPHPLSHSQIHSHSLTHTHIQVIQNACATQALLSMLLRLTHSLTHSLTYTPSLTHSLTHSLTYTPSLTHSLTHSHIHPLLLTHSLTHSHTPSLTHSLTHSHTHPLLLSLSLIQVIQNACATQALLSVLLNRPEINVGATLTDLRDFTREFSPEVCVCVSIILCVCTW